MRVNLLHAHGSPTAYLYTLRSRPCRCALCRKASREKTRRYYEENPERVRELARLSHERNVEKRREYHRRYYAAHREKVLERQHRYNEANREQIAERSRLRRLANPEKERERGRRYREAHPEQQRAASLRRKGRIAVSIHHTYGMDVLRQYVEQRGRCWYCGTDLGEDFHVDHFVPLCLGGADAPENIRACCPSCNLRKGSKHPADLPADYFEAVLA
jgi:5-methylcytosine-specific restriction endonuclease McrA